MSIKLKDTISDLINRANKDGSGNTITDTYLKLSGGDLTGDLSTTADIEFHGLGKDVYTLGTIFCRDNEFTLEGPLKENKIDSDKYPIYITWRGGYTTQGGLKLTGGSNGYLGGNKIWHEGNDGTNSGLDADLLDGKHSSSFSLTTHNHSGVYSEAGHTHSYLPLSGGTITRTSQTPAITIKNTTTETSASFIQFNTNAGNAIVAGLNNLGAFVGEQNKTSRIGVSWTGVPTYVEKDTGVTSTTITHTILHSGNYSTYAATKNHSHSYLPLSGGDLTGGFSTTGDIHFYGAGNAEYTMGAIICGTNFVIEAPIKTNEYSGAKREIHLTWRGGLSQGGLRLTGGSNGYLGSYQILHSNNYSTWAATKDHTHSGYLTSLPSHTHNYAGSSSAGGVATSANKLATSRTIWGQSFNGENNVNGNLNATGSRVTASYYDITTYGTGNLTIASIFSGTNDSITYGLCLEAAQSTTGALMPIFIGWRGGKRIMNIQNDTGVYVHHRMGIGQNTNGTAMIDAYDGIARFGCDDYGEGRQDSVGDKKAYISIKGTTGNVGIGTLTANSKLQVAGNITCSGVQGDSTSNNLTFRHLDGQNCNSNYNLYLQYHNQSWKTYFNGDTYYIDGPNYNGTAAKANKLSTARTLWGRSFDGSGNISGSINVSCVNFTNIGSGTYNIGQIINDSSNGLLFESALSSDSSSSTKLPMLFAWRGGKKGVQIGFGGIEIFADDNNYSHVNLRKNDGTMYHISNRSSQNKISIFYYDGSTYYERGWMTKDGLFNLTALAIGGEQITFTT